MSGERRPGQGEPRRLTRAEMEEIDLEAWARRLGFDAFDDLERLEGAIFGRLLEPQPAPEDPVRVQQVDPREPNKRPHE